MGEKTTAKVSTLLTPGDKARLQRAARGDKRKVSDFVRNLILDAITRHEQQETAQETDQ